MAEEPNQSIEYHIVTLFEKLEALKNENKQTFRSISKLPIKVEIRTLEFWRSVICECLASFIYVFIVCGASTGAVMGVSVPSIPLVVLSTALAAGFAMLSLTQCFGHISGAHINPAVTIAMGLTKNISFLRTIMFVVSQCGGGIAGAAFLYGVTVSKTQDIPSFTISLTNAPWEKFGIEFILTFIVVFSYFVSMDSSVRWTGKSAVTIGATYSACSFISPMPLLNPARSLGPSFVFSNWDNHWVYWVGPVVGGAAAGLIYEYSFNAKRHKRQETVADGDSSSIHSDEDTYDDLDKPAGSKYPGSTYNTYRPSAAATGPPGYCASLTSASLYSAPTTKLERVESLYGGTRSLYCKSPPLTRANLNRSQSVYTKSNSGVNRDILPKPGPLVPAQSLYPIKLNQQTHVQNQNLQNQLQQRSESIYGVRGVTPGTARSENYGTTERYNNKNSDTKYEENAGKSARPESMYGVLSSRRGQSTQSDDSSYGSYHGPAPRGNTYHSSTNFQNKSSSGNYVTRNTGNSEGRPPPPNQLLSTNANPSSSCHHSSQKHSPNPQY